MARCILCIAMLSLLDSIQAEVPASQPSSNAPLNADSAAVARTKLFLLRESDGSSGKHKYSLFLPKDYAGDKKYPVIVFLHGIGESGEDGIECTTVGLGDEIVRRNGDFAFIAIFPQTGMDWCTERSERILLDAIADVKKQYSVDEDHVSLTGIDSGGKATWYLGAKHPEIFAALAPMGAFSSEESVQHLTEMPIWVFHNDGDFVVPVSNAREMTEKIEAAGGHPKLTIYDEGGHDCFSAAYQKSDLFKWMLEQKRRAPAPKQK